MYRVTVVTEEKEYPLLNQVLRIQNPTLKECAGNSIGYLKFKISPDHPYYDKILPLESELYVYEDGEEIFRGRSITSEEEFNRTHQLTCESDLAYLCDSIVRPYEFTGGIQDFLTQVLDNHNAQVEARKRFRLGRVNVVDSNNYINRSNINYSNTLDCLRDKLVKTHGGYLRTRLENGIRYLDYVTDAGVNDQIIRYGVNLVDYSKTQDSTELFTALIPTGAKTETTNPDGTITTTVVDIKSVNGGIDYIYDEDAVAKYGWIFRHQEWEDVTLPENLIVKARAHLEQSIYLSDVLSLTAVDLANVNVDIARLKTGRWTKVISRPHGIDVNYILEERTRYLLEPGKDSISLGGTVATLSGSTAKAQAEMSAYVQQIANSTSKEINQKVNNATQLISGGLGGYVVIRRSDNGQPEEILIMDAPTKENAVNVIRLNKNGIGFSTSGYNGVYKNAWTIDGNLLADFITSGTMYADRIKGGTLTLGGVGNQNGVFKILDAAGKEIGTWGNTGLTLVGGNKSSANVEYQDNLVALSPSYNCGIFLSGGRKQKDGSYSSEYESSFGYDELLMTSVSVDTTDGTYEYSGNYNSGGFDLTWTGEAEEYTGFFAAHSFGVDNGTSGIYGDADSGLNIDGDLDVGGEKNRAVKTKNYGTVRLAAYETASPMFGDVGSGQIGWDGVCYIWIDPVLAATVNTSCEYQVFLQKYGNGDVWVSERTPAFFIVSGTPGIKFGWEVKLKQAGYEQNRLDEKKKRIKPENTSYAHDGAEYVKKYMEGLLS